MNVDALDKLREATVRLRESLRMARSRRRVETVPFLRRRGWIEVGWKFQSPYDTFRVVVDLKAAMKHERRNDTNTLLQCAEVACKFPTLEDLHALQVNITNGEDAADFISRMRGEE